MTDVVRNYSAGRTRRRSRSGSRSHSAVLIPIIGAAVFAAYAFWISRDLYALNEFIERDPEVSLYISRPLDYREEIAAADIWNVFPANHEARSIPDLLRKDWGMREWIQRNAIGSEAYVYSNEEGLLFLTRMSPVGVLTERAYRKLPRVKIEETGGLGIRYYADEEMYYAVRGRILLASSTRRSLIRALTLNESERASEWHRPGSGTDGHVGGQVRLGEDATQMSSIRFALRFDEEQFDGRFRIELNDDWKLRLDPLFSESRPEPIGGIYPGPLRVAASLELPIRDLVGVLDDVVRRDPSWQSEWDAWASETEGTMGPLLTSWLGDTESRFSMVWQDVDLNQVVPVPEAAIRVHGNEGKFADAFGQLPPPPTDAALDDGLAYYDSEAGRAEFPLTTGSGTLPVAHQVSGGLLLATSRTLSENLAGAPSLGLDAPDGANLYIGVDPEECIGLFEQAGLLLADEDLLVDHSVESLDELIREWSGRASFVNEAELWLSFVDGGIDGEFTLAYK